MGPGPRAQGPNQLPKPEKLFAPQQAQLDTLSVTIAVTVATVGLLASRVSQPSPASLASQPGQPAPPSPARQPKEAETKAAENATLLAVIEKQVKRLEALTIVTEKPSVEGRVFFACWVKVEDEEGDEGRGEAG